VKPGILGLGKNDLRECGRESMRETGLEWHRRYKGFHFQIFAFAKYGYQRRSKAYERRKEREHPEAVGRPLVFSGDSEQSAMASNVVVARAKSRWPNFFAAGSSGACWRSPTRKWCRSSLRRAWRSRPKSPAWLRRWRAWPGIKRVPQFCTSPTEIRATP
jgi:hypothetical protein